MCHFHFEKVSKWKHSSKIKWPSYLQKLENNSILRWTGRQRKTEIKNRIKYLLLLLMKYRKESALKASRKRMFISEDYAKFTFNTKAAEMFEFFWILILFHFNTGWGENDEKAFFTVQLEGTEPRTPETLVVEEGGSSLKGGTCLPLLQPNGSIVMYIQKVVWSFSRFKGNKRQSFQRRKKNNKNCEIFTKNNL